MIVITRTVVAAIIEWFSARVTATASPIWDKNDWERVIKFTLTKFLSKAVKRKITIVFLCSAIPACEQSER